MDSTHNNKSILKGRTRNCVFNLFQGRSKSNGNPKVIYLIVYLMILFIYFLSSYLFLWKWVGFWRSILQGGPKCLGASSTIKSQACTFTCKGRSESAGSTLKSKSISHAGNVTHRNVAYLRCSIINCLHA